MVDIRDYNKTASSNTDLFPEGMAPSALNDGGRAVQAELAQEIADESGTLTLGGTATAYTLTLNTSPASLTDGLYFSATANVTNTGGATTLVVTPSGGSSFASKKIKTYQSGAESDPAAGSIIAGNHYLFQYDSAADSGAGAFILINPTSNGLVLLASGTVAAAAALDISLPSGYRVYKILFFQSAPATSGANLNLRLSFDSGSTYKAGASDYAYAWDANTSNATATPNGGAATSIPLSSGQTAGPHTATIIDIFTPGAEGGAQTVILSESTTSGTTFRIRDDVAGNCTATTATATNVRLFYGSGNISSARYVLLGIRGS